MDKKLKDILKKSLLFYLIIASFSLFYTILAQFVNFFSVNFWIQTLLIMSIIPVICGYYYRKKFWDFMKISTFGVFFSVFISYVLGIYAHVFFVVSYFLEGIRNSSPVMSFFLAVCRPYLLSENVVLLKEGNIAGEGCPLALFDKTFLVIAFIIIAIPLIAGFMSLGKKIKSIS
ncbi:hypothetical protein KY345_06650 [Candidatus Woesearchaeota archaeon]|nr:hypothetical protein [Candidatus Woesearchaeota archaeon]